MLYIYIIRLTLVLFVTSFLVGFEAVYLIKTNYNSCNYFGPGGLGSGIYMIGLTTTSAITIALVDFETVLKIIIAHVI